MVAFLSFRKCHLSSDSSPPRSSPTRGYHGNGKIPLVTVAHLGLYFSPCLENGRYAYSFISPLVLRRQSRICITTSYSISMADVKFGQHDNAAISKDSRVTV